MRRYATYAAVLLLLLGLSACTGGAKADMPMEITVDGYTITLGETTVADLTALGYEAKRSKMPDFAKNSDKYIPFAMSLDRGAGDQVHVTVLVPWEGNSDISKETAFAYSEGVIRSVKVTLTSVKKVDVVYNGVDLNDIDFALATDEWGAKDESKDGSSNLRYTVEAKDGTVWFESSATSGQEFGSLNISLSGKKFEELQKN